MRGFPVKTGTGSAIPTGTGLFAISSRGKLSFLFANFLFSLDAKGQKP